MWRSEAFPQLAVINWCLRNKTGVYRVGRSINEIGRKNGNQRRVTEGGDRLLASVQDLDPAGIWVLVKKTPGGRKQYFAFFLRVQTLLQLILLTQPRYLIIHPYSLEQLLLSAPLMIMLTMLYYVYPSHSISCVTCHPELAHFSNATIPRDVTSESASRDH